jgi:hypothetical protein
MNTMGAQNALTARKGGLEATEKIGPSEPPQWAGRWRDRDIDMSGKFWLPAHI